MHPVRFPSILALALAVMGLFSGIARSEGGKVAPPTIAPGTEAEFFEKKVRPVLVEHCYKCHSADAAKLKGGLRLDTKEGLLKGGDTGPAVVPGNPEKSLLITAIHYKDEALQMPPKEPLTPQQVADLIAWVKAGAHDPRTADAKAAIMPAYDYAQWKQFWSFQPIREPAIPDVQGGTTTVVDRFIIAERQKRNLKAALPAEKRTLIRRAAFDLTGLPPTPEEVDAFLSDNSASAFEKVIDRLLASAAYGERWGRHWLDLVRYADTSGCNSDYPIPSAYLYRNYVINAFNADKPYDVFVTEQLAGDLLPHNSVEQRNERIIATTYLATARRFGSRAAEVHQTIEDMIDNAGKTMLGLSVSCARCHDHKFDPIPAADYYALYGIFNSSRYAFPGTEIYKHPKDFVPLGSPEDVEKLLDYESRVSDLDDRIEFLTKESRTALRGPSTQPIVLKDEDDETGASAKPRPKVEPRPADAPPLGELPFSAPKVKRHIAEVRAEQQSLQAQLRRLESRPPEIPKAYAVQEGLFQNARIHRKGDPRNKGEEVPRGFLTILGGHQLSPGEATVTSGRLQLAQWITDPENPLTARVMVNRIWQHHFGRGIVQTPNDFGSRGKAPTHPALLDYLARRFVESGYSIKAMHKLIMLTQAYQMASENEHERSNLLIDGGNDYLWRFNRRRLSAEEIRDAMLAVSGGLDAGMMTQAHPFPPENEWKYTQHKPFVGDVRHYDHRKRSIYLMQQRIKKHPFLEVFDGADTNASTDSRPVSITAVQALFIMNNPLAHELADKFAVRAGLAFGDDASRIRYSHELAFARPAADDEVAMGVAYVNEMREKMAQSGVSRDQLARAALTSYCRMLFGANEFLFVE